MFENIQQLTLYKRVLTPTAAGNVSHGVVIKPTMEVTYEAFKGEWVAYKGGIKNLNLPEGTKSAGLISVITEEELAVDNDLLIDRAVADYIYLRNPEDYPNTPAYKCIQKQPYLADPGFKNLTTDFYVMICARQSKDSM